MNQLPDYQPGAYYVSIIKGPQTILALGPFTRHARALGLVDSVRLRVHRAKLDPWAEFGYGTRRLPPAAAPMPLGQFNDVFYVGPDWRGPIDAKPLRPHAERVNARLLEVVCACKGKFVPESTCGLCAPTRTYLGVPREA